MSEANLNRAAIGHDKRLNRLGRCAYPGRAENGDVTFRAVTHALSPGKALLGLGMIQRPKNLNITFPSDFSSKAFLDRYCFEVFCIAAVQALDSFAQVLEVVKFWCAHFV